MKNSNSTKRTSSGSSGRGGSRGKSTSTSSSSSRGSSNSRGGNTRASSSKSSGTSRSSSRSSGRSSQSSSDGLKKIFEDELKDIYWAEKHLTKALPKMAKAAASEELRQAFEEHLEQTIEQVARLEQVFEICELRVQAKKCEAMTGLVEEAQEIISENDEGVIRDSALIIAGQKVEHYEMAAYGSLRTLAQVMGIEEAADLLQQTLDEEGETDKILTALAEQINQMAMEESEESEEEEEEVA